MVAETRAIEMPPLPADAVLKLLSVQSPDQNDERLAQLASLLEGNAQAVSETSRRLASGMPAWVIIEWLEQRRVVVARDAHGVEASTRFAGPPRDRRSGHRDQCRTDQRARDTPGASVRANAEKVRGAGGRALQATRLRSQTHASFGRRGCRRLRRAKRRDGAHAL